VINPFFNKIYRAIYLPKLQINHMKKEKKKIRCMHLNDFLSDLFLNQLPTVTRETLQN